MKYNLMGIVIENRNNKAPDVQEILTRFGCIINLRIGYHEKVENACLNEGLIILELLNNDEEIKKLKKELKSVEGIRVETLSI